MTHTSRNEEYLAQLQARREMMDRISIGYTYRYSHGYGRTATVCSVYSNMVTYYNEEGNMCTDDLEHFIKDYGVDERWV